jgi:hypothetical protein
VDWRATTLQHQWRELSDMEHHMQTLDDRLDRMIEIAEETGATLDDVVKAIGRADQTTFRAVSDNPSLLPRYMKSSVKP